MAIEVSTHTPTSDHMMFLLLTTSHLWPLAGVAPGGDPPEALLLHPPEADGRRAAQPQGPAGGGGGGQEEHGKAGLHPPSSGRCSYAKTPNCLCSVTHPPFITIVKHTTGVRLE